MMGAARSPQLRTSPNVRPIAMPSIPPAWSLDSSSSDSDSDSSSVSTSSSSGSSSDEVEDGVGSRSGRVSSRLGSDARCVWDRL